MLLPLDAIEAEFVDNQKIVGSQLSDLARQGLVGERGGQFGQEHGAGEVLDAKAVHTAAAAKGSEQKTLADPRLPDQDEIALAADEVAAGQFFDLRPQHGAFEFPVEAFQETDFAEAGVVNTAFDGAFAALVGEAAEQTMGELQRRPTFLLGLGQQVVKRLAGRGDLQGVQMVQQQAAQVRHWRAWPAGRRCRWRLAASFRHGINPR